MGKADIEAKRLNIKYFYILLFSLKMLVARYLNNFNPVITKEDVSKGVNN